MEIARLPPHVDGERIEVESRQTVVYNALHGNASLISSPFSFRGSHSRNHARCNPAGVSQLAFPFPSGGGLAQLGEHYVRNVGVGGSTPLPSTKPR
jgi:hypothetical protein